MLYVNRCRSCECDVILFTSPSTVMQRNLDLTEGEGAGKIYRYVEVLFMYLTMTGVKKIVRYTEEFDRYIEVPVP